MSSPSTISTTVIAPNSQRRRSRSAAPTAGPPSGSTWRPVTGWVGFHSRRPERFVLQTPHMAPGCRWRCSLVAQTKLRLAIPCVGFLDGRGVELCSGDRSSPGSAVLERLLDRRVVHPRPRVRIGAVGDRGAGPLERRSEARDLAEDVGELGRGGGPDLALGCLRIVERGRLAIRLECGSSCAASGTASSRSATAGAAVMRAMSLLNRFGLWTAGDRGSMAAGAEAAAATIGGLSLQCRERARWSHRGAPIPLTISTPESRSAPPRRRSAKRTATASRTRWKPFGPVARRGGVAIGADVERSGGCGSGAMTSGGCGSLNMGSGSDGPAAKAAIGSGSK